jgi:TRAP-type mannitol/chloroaromatic compound transport system permease large subunit
MTLLVFIGSMVGAMAIGVPVAFALMFCGVALMLHMDMFNAQIIAQNMVAGAEENFTLLAIPFFILAGELMNAGGLSRRIIDFAAFVSLPFWPRSSWHRFPARLLLILQRSQQSSFR